MDPSPVSKRDFLKGVLTTMLGAAVPAGALAASDRSSPIAPAGLPPLPKVEGSVIFRMIADVERALAKPAAERRWGMAIDRRKCVGCHACTVRCATENGLPPGIFYRPVSVEESGTYPQVARLYRPRPCMHCDAPPCVPVCPADATHKGADGVVRVDYDDCIGCGACVEACPYGARTLDEGKYFTKGIGIGAGEAQPYERRVTFEYGEPRNRSLGDPPSGKARKCHYCMHRVGSGMLPACVTTCIGHATFFGDLADPASLIAEMAKAPGVSRYMEEAGTRPTVFYLG